VTKRKDPSELSKRALAKLDTTPKPRVKRGKNATEEGKAARVAKLRKIPTNNSTAAIETYNPDRPLTEKMKLFAKFWAEGETIMSASVRAGYADGGSMAYRLSRDPAILKIYNAEKALYEDAAQMTRKKVMEGFIEAAEMAKTLADPTALTGAWREIGKMCGYYEPVKRSIDINLKGEVTVKKLERASDADLLKLIKGEIEDVEFNEVETEDE
jgi:hypothetical protein